MHVDVIIARFRQLRKHPLHGLLLACALHRHLWFISYRFRISHEFLMKTDFAGKEVLLADKTFQ
jgi:hypothetical protein